jgi:two-component system nitrogen regulation response regulator GlnG
LFYRLNVVSIRLPPLRERLEDVDDLARAFLLRARREGLPEKSIDTAAIERLKAHSFPGNVRELENLLRRAAAMSPAPVITAREIGEELGQAARASQTSEQVTDGFEDAVSRRLATEFAAASPGLPASGLYDRLLAEVERPLILQALSATRGNQIRAAAVLGINRNTLRKKIQTLGIQTGRGD